MKRAEEPRQRSVTSLRRLLKAELRAEERLIWSGRPDPKVMGRRADFVGAVFSCVIFGGFTAIMMGIAPVMGLFMLPIGGLCVWSLLGRSRARARAKATLYAITDLRAICVRRGAKLEVTSFYLSDSNACF
jgi:hypothetical protein